MPQPRFPSSFSSVVVVPVLCLGPAFGSSSHKCKTPACDINAIGHRKFFNGPSVGNWYSTEKEKELGVKYSAVVEQRVDQVKDAGIIAYVDQVAQRIAQNSDADIPITVHIIRRNDAGAFTLFGGHLYLTTGLLLTLHSEGELASVLARGIAHTAMRSVARLRTRTTLMEAASIPESIPVFAIDSVPHALADNDIALQTFSLLKLQRGFEREADTSGFNMLTRPALTQTAF